MPIFKQKHFWKQCPKIFETSNNNNNNNNNDNSNNNNNLKTTLDISQQKYEVQ